MVACWPPELAVVSLATRTTPEPGLTAPAAVETAIRASEARRKLIALGLDFLKLDP
jgi:hypothetical protein